MKPRLPEVITTHAVLLLMATLGLYPGCWVLGLALTPGGQLGAGPNPLRLLVSSSLGEFGAFLFG